MKLSKDSLYEKSNLPVEGNLLKSVSKLIGILFDLQDETIFFLKPVKGFISRGYDTEKGHPGIDIVVKEGTPVFSTAGGYVVFADYTTEFGNMMIVIHSFGYISVYKHCSSLLKKQREIVEQGEMIALSGNTGHSTGPHLHFEIWKDGQTIDPESVLINN